MANIVYTVQDQNNIVKVGTRELKEICRIEVKNGFICFLNIDGDIITMTPTPNKNMNDKVTITL